MKAGSKNTLKIRLLKMVYNITIRNGCSGRKGAVIMKKVYAIIFVLALAVSAAVGCFLSRPAK